VTTDVLLDNKRSLLWKSRSDLEFNSISEWLSWVSDTGSVEGPSLVGTVVAVVEDGMSVVGV